MTKNKTEILIGVYKEHDSNMCLLNYRDAYQVLNRNNAEHKRLVTYIKKYCEMLNYPVIHGREMIMESNVEYEKLMNWVNGYNYAKELSPKIESHRVIIEADEYIIVLCKPFDI